MSDRCRHCGITCTETEISHWDEGGHDGYCCDCFDLGWFPESLDKLNEERKVKGRPPIERLR